MRGAVPCGHPGADTETRNTARPRAVDAPACGREARGGRALCLPADVWSRPLHANERKTSPPVHGGDVFCALDARDGTQTCGTSAVSKAARSATASSATCGSRSSEVCSLAIRTISVGPRSRADHPAASGLASART